MPIARFQLPDGRIARFEVPEGTTPEQAQALAPQLLAQIPAAPQEETGFFSGIERGFRQAVGSGAFGLGELTGVQPLAQYGTEVSEGQPEYAPTTWEEVKQAYEQEGLVGAAAPGFEFVKEQTGQVLGGLGPYLAAARLGAAAGSPLGPYGSVAGAVLLPAASYFYGEDVMRQEQERQAALARGEEAPEMPGTAETLGYATLQSLAERTGLKVLSRYIPGINKLMGTEGPEVARQTAERIAKQGLTKTVGKGAVAGVATEVPVELTQTVLERQAAGLDLTGPEANREYEEVIAATIAGVAPLGGVGGVTGRASARGKVEREKLARETAQRKAIESEFEEPEAPLEGVAEPEEAGVDYGVTSDVEGVGRSDVAAGVKSDVVSDEATPEFEEARARVKATGSALRSARAEYDAANTEQGINIAADNIAAATVENLLAQADAMIAQANSLRQRGEGAKAGTLQGSANRLREQAKIRAEEIADPKRKQEILNRIRPPAAPEVGAGAENVVADEAKKFGLGDIDLDTPEGRAAARQKVEAKLETTQSGKVVEGIQNSEIKRRLDETQDADAGVDTAAADRAALDAKIERSRQQAIDQQAADEQVGTAVDEQVDTAVDEQAKKLPEDRSEWTIEDYATAYVSNYSPELQPEIKYEAEQTFGQEEFSAEVEKVEARKRNTLDALKGWTKMGSMDMTETVTVAPDENVRAGFEAKDTTAVLDALKKSSNPVHAAVANRFEESGITPPKVSINKADVEAKAKERGALDPTAVQGYYRLSTHEVVLRSPEAAANTETVVHELTHSQASKVLAADPDTLTAEQREGRKQLVALYEHVKQNAGEGAKSQFGYALSNQDEFLSEGMGNATFQKYLQGVEYQNTSAWTKFVEAIAKMLGLKPDTAFTEMLSAYEKITTQPEAKPVSKAKQATDTETDQTQDTDKLTKAELTLKARIERAVDNSVLAVNSKHLRIRKKPMDGPTAVKVRDLVEQVFESRKPTNREEIQAATKAAIEEANQELFGVPEARVRQMERQAKLEKEKAEAAERVRKIAAGQQRSKERAKDVAEAEALRTREKEKAELPSAYKYERAPESSKKRVAGEKIKEIFAGEKELDVEGVGRIKRVQAFPYEGQQAYIESLRRRERDWDKRNVKVSRDFDATDVDNFIDLDDSNAIVAEYNDNVMQINSLRKRGTRMLRFAKKEGLETETLTDAINSLYELTTKEDLANASQVIREYEAVLKGETAQEIEGDYIAFRVAPKLTSQANRDDMQRIVNGAGNTVFVEDTSTATERAWENTKQAFYKEDAKGKKVRKTNAELKQDVVNFGDRVATQIFSRDAAARAEMMRRNRAMPDSEKAHISTMIEVSTAQALHSENVAAGVLERGNAVYDNDVKKYRVEDSEYNYPALIEAIQRIAQKYGVEMVDAESMAHTYLESRRLLAILKDEVLKKRRLNALKAKANKTNADRAEIKRLEAFLPRNPKTGERTRVHKTLDQINAGLAAVDKYPEVTEVAEIWEGFRKNIIDIIVDSGMVSKDMAEVWLDNADYVPFYRQTQIEAGEGPREFISGLVADPNKKRLKGTDRPVNNVFDNIERWAEYYVDAAVRNKSSGKIMAEMVRLDMAHPATQEELANPMARANIVRVWDKGTKRAFFVEQPVWIETFRGIESAGIPLMGMAAKFTNLLRKSVVLNPFFSLGQLTQDAFGAMFSSGLPVHYALRLPFKVIKEFTKTLAGTSAAHEELKRYGAAGERDYISPAVRMDMERIATNLRPDRAGVLTKLLRKAETFSMASDNAVRQAIYEYSLAEGASKAEAVERAFEVINFRRRGAHPGIHLAARMVPFFNAYLQAMNVQIKTLSGEGISPRTRPQWNALMANMGTVMALTFLYSMLLADDEDYQKLDGPLRDRMLVIPGTGGYGVPLRTDLFLMPKIMVEHMYRLSTDAATEDSGTFWRSIKTGFMNSALGPTPMPQIFKPTLEWSMDYSFFTGRNLVSQQYAELEPYMQYNQYTSELSKLIGGALNVSPIKLDNWLRGTFGSAGGAVLWGSNLIGSWQGARPTQSVQDLLATFPGLSRFINKEFGTADRSMFYEMSREINRAYKTYLNILENDPDKLDPFLGDKKNLIRIQMAKTTREISTKLSQIRKSIEQASRMKGISPEARQQLIEDMREYEQMLLSGINLKERRALAQM